MPCMYNGMPVKGNKGSCPMNSTWEEPQAQAPTDDRNFLEKAGGYLMNNKLEAASIGAMAIPFAGPAISGGLRGASLLAKGASMGKGRLGKLMDKMFRKEGTPATPGNPGFTMPKGVNTQSRSGNKGGVNRTKNDPTPITGGASPGTAATRVMRTPSARGLAYTGLGVAGAGGLYASGADDRQSQQQAMQSQQQTQATSAIDANTAALTAANATQAESDRVAGLNPLEAMMENMKKPGYWTNPMNEGGPKSDNRLNRLGQLMNYYGSTPKQRATMDSPQKSFLATEQQQIDNQAAFAKAQQTLSSPYGKPSVANLADSLENKVKAQFGDTWLTFGAEEDEIPAIAKAVAIRITQLTQQYPGSDPDMIESEAFKQIEEEGWKEVSA